MNKTMIFAHRGANKEAAENTRTAFEKALNYPIDGIETDIQLSRDGVPILWHDDDLARLGRADLRTDNLDYAQMQGMNFAAHFAGAAVEGVMRLDDFVSSYHPRCRLLLEIKRYPDEPVAQQQSKVQQTLAMAGGSRGAQILASSFDLDSLIYAHTLVPDVPLVLNLEPEHDANFARRTLVEHPYLYGLCVHIATLDEVMMGVVRYANKFIAVYTCNSDEHIDRALTLGVDVLISDYPQKALQRRK